MIWDHITDPAKRMKRAARKCFDNPRTRFWAVLGLTMGFVATDTVDRMATDGKRVFYNPAYVMTISEDECIAVIAHEISHPAWRHFERLKNWPNDIANIGGDHEINICLTKAGFKLPTDCLCDFRFDGLSAEQICNIVSRENEDDKRQGKPERHQPGSSGNMIQPSDDAGQPFDAEQMAEFNDQWRAKTAQALGAARKSGYLAGGDIPTELVAVTASINAPSVMDWRQPLRAFIDNLGSRHRTWAKFSRRGLSRGLVLPGERVVRPSKIAWIVDCSGSMDTAKNEQALIEGQAALDELACDAIDVIYTDTRVKDIDSYMAGDTVKVRSYNGGGTNFNAVMQHIADSEDDYAAIVFVTDGQTSAWGIDPEIPCLWAITDSQPATDRLKPPFGEKLCLYTS